MIFRNELQNAIKEYFISKSENKEQMVEITEANADIQKIIEELDANPWNPVEESVPTDERYVLLSFENFTLPLIGRYEQYEDGSGNWYLGDCDEEDTCLANDLYVNAWMPLPERYEEESDRNDGTE